MVALFVDQGCKETIVLLGSKWLLVVVNSMWTLSIGIEEDTCGFLFGIGWKSASPWEIGLFVVTLVIKGVRLALGYTSPLWLRKKILEPII